MNSGTYRHLFFLGEIKAAISVLLLAGRRRIRKMKVGPTTQSKHVSVAEKEPTISFAHESTIPIRPVLGKIFGVDEGVDFVRFVALVDDRVDPDVPLGDKRVVDNVLTSYGEP